MFLLNQRVTWWSVQSPCGKWKEIPWSSLCFKRTERLGVCVCESEEELGRHLHCMASPIWQPIYLRLLPSSPTVRKGPMMVSPSSQQYTEASFLGVPAIIYRANHSRAGHSRPSSINHLWVRSLHHNSHLPRHASPLPCIHKHTAV